jgi:hypothetical protein
MLVHFSPVRTWALGTHPPKLAPARLPALPPTCTPARTITNKMSTLRTHFVGYRTRWHTRFPCARTWAQGTTHPSTCPPAHLPARLPACPSTTRTPTHTRNPRNEHLMCSFCWPSCMLAHACTWAQMQLFAFVARTDFSTCVDLCVTYIVVTFYSIFL